MTDRIEDLDISFTVRNIAASSRTSSEMMNDLIEELGHDLATIREQWNNRLVPLILALPYGETTATVDAFLNGLDGKNMYVDNNSSTTSNASYYNSTAGRPNTVYEQIQDLYTSLSALEESVSYSVNNLSATATNVAIADASSLYVAGNVEDALTEVMTAVNSLDLSQGASSIRRMTTAERDAISSPTNGMVIYNTTLNKFQGYENSSWVTFTTT